MKYIFFLIFFSWSGVSGIVEAILYSGLGARALKMNEHIIFTAQRVLVLTMAATCLYIGHLHKYCNFVDGMTALVCCVFAFSFWHNGAYYVTRHKIDSPQYGFFSNSHTSTAFLELNAITRIALFIVSLIGICLI